MELDEFLAALDRLTGDDIRLVAKALDLESSADEVDWWRATIAIDRAVRHARVTRHAARAAWDAAERVQGRAVLAGFDLPDDAVTRVARAAAEVARGLTVGPATQPIVRLLLEPWAMVLPVA